MKKKIHFLTILTSIFCLSVGFGQEFSFSPEKPIAGEKVTITYSPKGGPLEGNEFEAIAHGYESLNDVYAADLDFNKQGNAFVAVYEIPKNAKLVAFTFSNSKLEKTDDNNGKGFKLLVHKADRSAPLAGALGFKSALYMNQGKRFGIKPDLEKAYNLAKQELAANPKSLEEKGFAWTYATLAFKQNDELAINQCKAIYQNIAAKKNATEEELILAALVAKSLDDAKTSEELEARAEKEFPNGTIAKNKMQGKTRTIKTLDEKLAFYAEAKQKFGKDKDMSNFLNTCASTIANEYAQNGDWANFEKHFDQISDRGRAAGILNGLAWPLSGESIEGEAKDVEKGLKLSAKSLELLKAEMDDQVSKPAFTSPRNYKKNLEFSYGMYADTYALLAYKKGNYADAFKYQSIACEQNDFADGEMTERYCAFYEKVNDPKPTEKLLADFIAKGKANSKMKEQHKRLFLANNSLESAYEKYSASLEKEAKSKKRAEVEAKMMSEDAPVFTLKNLKGETVSMENLRGKVLVLDFWATWCGPCKASFPGMQSAVNKFASRKDVEFLFIDTWENGTDKAKLAGDFIASKAYTFNVLMDIDNEVVGKYKVDGIPTKFVVDKNGKIRFKSVGFSGNDEELVDELSTMIELAGGETMP